MRLRSGGATRLGGLAKRVVRLVKEIHISSAMHESMQNTAGHGKILRSPPYVGEHTSTIRVHSLHVTDTHHCVPSCTRETTTPRETIYEHIEAQNCPRALKNFKWETPSAMMRLGCGGKSSGCRTPRPTLSAWRRKRCVSNRYHKLPVHNYTKYLLPSALLCSTHLELS